MWGSLSTPLGDFMGRDYKDIVRELWEKVPQMLEKAEKNLEKQEENYWNIVDMIMDAFFDAEMDDALEKAEESLYQAQETYDQCHDMMDSLETDDFITIIEKYFDGFFELDGEIE